MKNPTANDDRRAGADRRLRNIPRAPGQVERRRIIERRLFDLGCHSVNDWLQRCSAKAHG